MLDKQIADALGARTIADLCREAARRGVARVAVEPASYQI
jgi:hypothetical protein